jgi:hypothetical protein
MNKISLFSNISTNPSREIKGIDNFIDIRKEDNKY